MNRKAEIGIGEIVTIIIIAAIALALFVIISFVKDILTEGTPSIKICSKTNMAETYYLEEIKTLLERTDVAKISDQEEKRIVELYKEFISCFPDSNFDVYAENSFGEQETFKFIFIMKEQKYYDKITLKIAQRYLIRFPASTRSSDVNAYINEAKAALD